MTWATALWIGLGGALGSVGRAWVAVLLPATFPWATLVVNLAGSFALGIWLGWESRHPDWLAHPARHLLVTGFCGGFTTFSTFSGQTLHLLLRDQPGVAALNVALNLLGCLLGAWLGWLLGRLLAGG